MVQGDSYRLSIALELDADMQSVDTIEVMIGALRKTWPDQVIWDNGQLLVPLTQEETFRFGTVETVQVRVKMLSGDVYGSAPVHLPVLEAISKVVL